ncbi:MAG: hypothetical protein NZ925_06055, partial [Sulfolobales archaeon]|nr:hypothetical protein [Sulfolobales archaeon]
GIRRGRLVVFVGYGPRSQRLARRISLMVEKLRCCYEVSLVHVPDDALDELPYVRIEPLSSCLDGDADPGVCAESKV